MNHYKWLDKNFIQFLLNLGMLEKYAKDTTGISGAHGDKGYQYKEIWKENGIHFYHGMAIYLLTYLLPYNNESRETEKGWVAPCQWVVDNYEKGHNFKQYLPEINEC